MKKDRTIEQRIADIVDAQALFDAAGVRNASQVAKAIMSMLNSRRYYAVTSQNHNHEAK